jgi:glycosyltransferase involved in cell wall biosynthesis
MYHANIVGALANALLCRAPLVSGIHHANLDPAYNKLSTRLAAITGAAISRWLPDCVICVSRSALEMHKAIGYDPAIMEYIPNGVDTGYSIRMPPPGLQYVNHSAWEKPRFVA